VKRRIRIDIKKRRYLYLFVPLILKAIIEKLAKDGSVAKDGSSTLL